MTYVPVVTPPPSSTPSPRTRELAELLARVLEEYRKSHPEVKSQEIRAAVRLALRSAQPGGGDRARLVVSLGLGIAVFLGGLVFLQVSGESAVEPMLPGAVLVLLILLALMFVIIRRRAG